MVLRGRPYFLLVRGMEVFLEEITFDLSLYESVGFGQVDMGNIYISMVR